MGFIVWNFLFRHVVFTLPDGIKNQSVLRNGLYCITKWALSWCDIGHIGARNGPYQSAKWAISQRSMEAVGLPENANR